MSRWIGRGGVAALTLWALALVGVTLAAPWHAAGAPPPGTPPGRPPAVWRVQTSPVTACYRIDGQWAGCVQELPPAAWPDRRAGPPAPLE